MSRDEELGKIESSPVQSMAVGLRSGGLREPVNLSKNAAEYSKKLFNTERLKTG